MQQLSLINKYKPSSHKVDTIDTLEFTVELPDRYFQPRKADIVLSQAIKAHKKD